MSESAWGCVFTVIACVVSFALGVMVCGHTVNGELVKRGLKQYNATTGVLEWTKKADAE